MKYAHYNNQTKEILGFYESDIHDAIPLPNIQIAEDEWLEALNTGANKVKNGKLVYEAPPTPILTIEELKKIKISELNENINKAYHAYLAKYPDVEVRSFDEKARESFLVKKNSNTSLDDTPLLCSLVGRDKTKRNELANQVYAKIEENTKLEAWGVLTRDAIKAAENEEALNAISIEVPSV